MTLGLRNSEGTRDAGRLAKAWPVLVVILVIVLVWAWWDGGEQPLTAIEHPVDFPPELTGDLAEGQE